MAKLWRPALGDMVCFTQSLGKWSAEEYEAAMDGDLQEIAAKLLPNPDRETPAMVVGVVSKSIEADARWDEESGRGFYVWNTAKRRTFYVLKRKLRGPRILVPIEDLTLDPQTVPSLTRSEDGTLVATFKKTVVYYSMDDGATWTAQTEIGTPGKAPVEDPFLGEDPWLVESVRIAGERGIPVQVITANLYGRCPYCSTDGALLNPDPTGKEPFVCSECMK